MSWALFKVNILKYANNPNSLPDLKKVASLWTKEYDAAVKRGYDTVNLVKVQKGNIELMEQLVYAALLKGQNSKQPYDLVGELGNAVKAYWTGATLNNTPIPIIPSLGATVNIAVTSNVVTNIGQWTPPQQVPPQPTPPNPLKQDFEQYKQSEKTYDEIFKTTIVIYDNRQPTPTQIKQDVLDYRKETGLDANPNISDTSDIGKDNEDTKPKPKINPVKGDKKLFDKVSNGLWPAKGEYGNFQVDIKTTSKEDWYKKLKQNLTSDEINKKLQETSGKGIRVWWEQNPDYIAKNLIKINIPTANGNSSILVHKQLKTIVDPAIEKIKQKGLQKYIATCAGGLAVRNVTNGTRLSNHSWGLAIDMNANIYPIGYKFGADGIYNNGSKLRDFNDFDLGFLEVAKVFQNEGMTWLQNFDPMHVSIYE